MIICKKCENRITTGTKCYQCGYDISKGLPLDYTADKNKNKKKRSPVLIGIMTLFILFNIIPLLSDIGILIGNLDLINLTTLFSILTGITNSVFFVNIPVINPKILAVITIAVILFDIILCVYIIGLKKWAFKAYIGLTVIGSVLRIADTILIITVAPWVIFRVLQLFIIKGVLLFIVYIIDGKHFGGDKLTEPISVIRARQRKEREEKESVGKI